jgi:DNA polymerase-3 subunit epsilon
LSWQEKLLGVKRQHRLIKSRITFGPMLEYFRKDLPDPKQSVRDTEFLALDFETTGLDAEHDAILSIGCTVISQGRIQLMHNDHQIIKLNIPLPKKSVVIHGITDDRILQGIHLHDALEILLPKIAGRVMLVHFANIEKNFINAACRRVYGQPLPAQYVDTLEVEHRRLQRKQLHVAPRQLRLFNLRDFYRLPRYHAHNALEDAIATAELFLAQVAHGDGLDSPLKQWLL